MTLDLSLDSLQVADDHAAGEARQMSGEAHLRTTALSAVTVEENLAPAVTIAATINSETPRPPLRALALPDLIWLSLFWFAINFQWGALLTVVLPVEVLRFVPESQKGTALGLLLAGGALVALLVTPVAGALSDRSTLPLGRRRPFIIAGTLLNCLGLIGMQYAPAYIWFFVAFLVLQAANNLAGAAFHGLIPDKVPPAQRGVASGLMGLLTMLGVIAAVVLSGTLVGRGHAGMVYGVIGAVLLLCMALTTWKVDEEPLRRAPRFALGEFVRSFWIGPRRYPDFAWMFATRALVMLGFYTILAFLQYFIKDTYHLGGPQAAQATATIGAVVIATAGVAALGAGWASDRIGRKSLVSLAGAFLAATGAVFVFQPPFAMLVWCAALCGIGYGTYTSVDWALAVDVLPSSAAGGKDLGIWSMANTLPQVLGPAMAGPLLDAFNHQAPNLGYSVVFSASILYVLLGSVFVWKIRGAR
jgi:MFS family permease